MEGEVPCCSSLGLLGSIRVWLADGGESYGGCGAKEC